MEIDKGRAKKRLIMRHCCPFQFRHPRPDFSHLIIKILEPKFGNAWFFFGGGGGEKGDRMYGKSWMVRLYVKCVLS